MISADSSTHSSLPRKEAGQPQTVFRKYAASIKNTSAIVSEARRGVAAETFFDVADASLLNQNLLELLETSGGIDLVMDQLLRIAYGDLA
jgi:hypothetical protein